MYKFINIKNGFLLLELTFKWTFLCCKILLFRADPQSLNKHEIFTNARRGEPNLKVVKIYISGCIIHIKIFRIPTSFRKNSFSLYILLYISNLYLTRSTLFQDKIINTKVQSKKTKIFSRWAEFLMRILPEVFTCSRTWVYIFRTSTTQRAKKADGRSIREKKSIIKIISEQDP